MLVHFNANKNLHPTKTGINFTECIADHWAKEHESRNNNDGYQNKNERVLDKTLSFFFGQKQHESIPPFQKISHANVRLVSLYNYYFNLQAVKKSSLPSQ